MIVTLPAEVEKQLIALATQKGLDADSYLLSLVQKELGNSVALDQQNGHGQDEDFDPEAGNRAVRLLTNRTPEQIKAAQERAIREFKPKRELPATVSPLEMLPVIRGNETDEEVLLALRDLS